MAIYLFISFYLYSSWLEIGILLYIGHIIPLCGKTKIVKSPRRLNQQSARSNSNENLMTWTHKTNIVINLVTRHVVRKLNTSNQHCNQNSTRFYRTFVIVNINMDHIDR